ncbi:MAG: hypothetical protein RSI33_03110 [Clostridia bacterium]
MMIFMVGICYLEAESYGQTLTHFHEAHWGELLHFCFSKGCNITITSVLFLITISEIPRQMNYQYQHIIRSNRTAWLNAQLVYCLGAVLFMQMVMVLFVGLFMLPFASPGTGWTEPALAAQGLLAEHESILSLSIAETLSPAVANLLAQLPMIAFRMVMTSLILLMSLYGHGDWGVIAYVFILMADRIILVEAFQGIVLPAYFSSWGSCVAMFHNHQWLTSLNEAGILLAVLVGYTFVMGVLYLLMLRRIKRCDLIFDSGEKA